MATRYAGEKPDAHGNWVPVRTPKKKALKVALAKATKSSGSVNRRSVL